MCVICIYISFFFNILFTDINSSSTTPNYESQSLNYGSTLELQPLNYGETSLESQPLNYDDSSQEENILQG